MSKLDQNTLDLMTILNAINALSSTENTAELLEGDGQEYYTMAPSALSFRSTAPLDDFQEVQINGQTIDPSSYTLEEGSTVVNLSIEYLKTLDTGNYNVDVVSNNQVASGCFTVKAPELNEYGFYYNQPYYIEVEMPFEFASVVMFDTDGTAGVYQIDSSNSYLTNYTYENNIISFELPNDQTWEPGIFNGYFSTDGKEIFGTLEIGDLFIQVIDTTLQISLDKVACDDIYLYYPTWDDTGEYEYFPIKKTLINYPSAKTNIFNIPVSVIAYEAFLECNLLESVIIPDSITNINGSAFHSCENLTKITIPNNVSYIGPDAFYGCENLTNIIYNDTIEQWNLINKIDNWNGGVPATYVQCSDGQVAL